MGLQASAKRPAADIPPIALILVLVYLTHYIKHSNQCHLSTLLRA